MAAELVACSFPEYLALDGVQRSALEDFITEGPEYYEAAYVKREITKKVTPDMEFGQVFHDFVLGTNETRPLEIPRDALNDDGHKKGSAWKQFAKENEGRILMLPDAFSVLQKMLDKCMEHPWVRRFLEHKDRVVENVIAWDDPECGLRRKCRPDLMIPGQVLVDFKTYKPTDFQTFSRGVAKRGYHRQSAFYDDGHAALYGKGVPFVFVAARKDPPYSVRVLQIHDHDIAAASQQVDVGLQKLRRHYDTGVWKEHEWDEIKMLHLPPWEIPAED